MIFVAYFMTKKGKLLQEIQEYDCQEIRIRCTASGHFMTDNFQQKACNNFKKT